MGAKSRVMAICLIVASLAASFAFWRHAQWVAHNLSRNEYDVASAILTATFEGTHSDPSVRQLVITSLTDSGESDPPRDGNGRPLTWAERAGSLRADNPSIDQSTLDDFHKANAHQAKLRRLFHLNIQYQVVDEAWMESEFKIHHGWPAFYARFPNSQGILTISRVGFSKDGRQALVYIKNSCGGLCGGGNYMLMEKRDGRWEIAKEINVWMS